jgi:hypothetical protein
MILKYIKNSVRALVNTIIKWNNNDAMKWGRGWEDMKFFFICFEQQTTKMLIKRKIIKWENAIENVYMVFNWTEDEVEECGMGSKTRKIE